MIGTIFEFGNEVICVEIHGTSCLFRTQNFGGALVPIENLKLDKAGCIKEHPDLEDKIGWKEETIRRFKVKMKSFPNEMERMRYVIEELKKHGYNPIIMQRSGFKPVRIKQ